MTFSNPELKVSETVTVDVDANQPASLGRDYSDRVKPPVVKDKDRTLDPTKDKPAGESKDKTINPFKKS